MYNLKNKLENSKTNEERTELLINYYSQNQKQTINTLDNTKYINELIPIILEKKDFSNLLEIKSINVMKLVQSSLQFDLILTNPILKEDINNLLIYLISTNCKNIDILEEEDNVKLYKIWQAIIKGHKQFKYNNVLIQTNNTINWSYDPNPTEISKVLNKKCEKSNITQKKFYLKKILDEIENPDLDEFLDYVDTYFEKCIECKTKTENIFQRFSNMLTRSTY